MSWNTCWCSQLLYKLVSGRLRARKCTQCSHCGSVVHRANTQSKVRHKQSHTVKSTAVYSTGGRQGAAQCCDRHSFPSSHCLPCRWERCFGCRRERTACSPYCQTPAGRRGSHRAEPSPVQPRSHTSPAPPTRPAHRAPHRLDVLGLVVQHLAQLHGRNTSARPLRTSCTSLPAASRRFRCECGQWRRGCHGHGRR